MSIMSALKQGTANHHDKTEKLLLSGQIMDGSLTYDGYRYMVLCNYLFNASLEKALLQRENELQGYNLQARLKTEWLVKDLQLNNIPVEEVPEYFSDWSTPELLGAAYVAEGSTLGGKYIERGLQANPNITGKVTEFNYFHCYGTETGSMWKSFGEYVTARAEGNEEAIVNGAVKAFDVFADIATSRQLKPETI